MSDQNELNKPTNFQQTFFENRIVPDIFCGVVEQVNGESLYTKKNDLGKGKIKKVYSFTDVPGYLNLQLCHSLKNYNTLEYPVFNGYLANLGKYQNIEEFLKDNFGKNGRSKIRRYCKRLDLCFEPTYKMYYGKISEDEYNRIFDRFRELMMRRFSQKKEENLELKVLDEYRVFFRNLILEKKASLFVIYHGKKAINITMNIAHNNVLASYNSSYDIDYESFSLGTIDLFKHIEWCFNNGFNVFDLGRGDYIYKRRWTNHKYCYNHKVIYDRSSLYLRLTTKARVFLNQKKYDLIQKLKKFGVQHLYSRYFKLRYLLFKRDLHVSLHTKYDCMSIDEAPPLQSLNPINIDDSDNEWLLKPINDFIYKSHQKFNEIQVFRSIEKPSEFFLMGNKQTQKIVVPQ